MQHATRLSGDGKRVYVPRCRDAFLSLNTHITEVSTLDQTFTMQGTMTMMIDLTPADVEDLKRIQSIDPFPEIDKNTRKDPHADEDDRPRVLTDLGNLIKNHHVDLLDVSYQTNKGGGKDVMLSFF